MALTQDELFKLDLYDILELDVKCTLQEVKRAFRKKALKCHPDKNPDDPNAAQLFHQLSCALEILSDESARAAYDKVLSARKATHIRNQQLDSRRKKLKEDLERRERNAQNPNFINDELKLQAEIERLRKEGSRLLQEEIKKVNEQLKSSEYINSKIFEHVKEDHRGQCFTIRWKTEKGDADNGGYNYQMLHKILSKCGDVSALVISPKKKGKAVVEFKTCDISILQGEIGLPENPWVIENLTQSSHHKSSPPTSEDSSSSEQNNLKRKNVFPSFGSTHYQPNADSFVPSKWSSGKNTTTREKDELLEITVLQRLRNMEKMKRAAEGDAADK